METAARYNPGLHTLALLTALATFPLIFMGGLVTSHGAGLSVPDWPNSYGYNMFLFPPRLWSGGIFYEHTHRLMGTVVGMLSVALAACAWITDRRRSVRWLATAVLAAVIFQGVLGGLRVVLLKLDLAIVHACVAQAFFCLTALTAVVTSRWWLSAPPLSDGDEGQAGRRLVKLACAAALLIYLQLIVGATMRHYDAGLAITDLPLAYGRWIPATDAGSLRRINVARLYDHLQKVTAGQIWLHFAHRVGAIVVSAAVLVLVIRIFARHRKLAGMAMLLLALLAAQIALGVFTVLYRKPADVASAHVAVGALVLVTAFLIAARAVRLYVPGAAPGPERVAEGFPVQQREILSPRNAGLIPA